MSLSAAYSPSYRLYRRVRAAGSLAYGILIVLPVHVIANTIPSLRANPRCSFTRSVVVAFTRWFIQFAGTYRDVVTVLRTPKIVQARLDELGARYDEAPVWHGELKGEVRDWGARRGIESVKVPLFWGGKRGRPEPAQRADVRVLISFHGGGYMSNSAHPEDVTSFAPVTITAISKTVHVYCAVEYRLSALPTGGGKSTNPFPTALLDGITAFRYLLSLGYQPQNIYLLGDSAGGNLVMALVRYLCCEGKTQLGGIILLSPWLDISGSHSIPGLSRIDKKKTDYLGNACEPGSNNYLAFLGGPEDCMTPETPYVSPSCRNIPPPTFEGFPRTFISMGEDEQFLDEGKTLRQRMRKYLSDEQLVLDITPAAPHDYFLISMYEPERTDLMRRISEWIDRH